MKTFNFKHILFLTLTTLTLSSCMPDSLTKFKKDPPKSPDETIVDDSGSAMDPSQFINPTFLRMMKGFEGAIQTEFIYSVGNPVNIRALFDGSVSQNPYRQALFRGCTITPALPPGLSLQNLTSNDDLLPCSISGIPTDISTNPLNPGLPINYTITLSYVGNDATIRNIQTSIQIGVYEIPLRFTYTEANRVLLSVSENLNTLNDVVSNNDHRQLYNRKGFITSSTGVIGVVKLINKEQTQIGVAKTISLRLQAIATLLGSGYPTTEFPSLSSTNPNIVMISSENGAHGKIIKVSLSEQKIYVEQIGEKSFVQGERISKGDTYNLPVTANITRIEEIDQDYTYKKDPVTNSLALDNNLQFFKESFLLTRGYRTYQVGKQFGSELANLLVLPTAISARTLTSANGVKFKVSPELPSGLVFNELTGEITGEFSSDQNITTHLVTATNPVGSFSYELGLMASHAPTDLSYTTHQLISVKNNSSLIKEQNLYQQIILPLDYSVAGKILRTFDACAAPWAPPLVHTVSCANTFKDNRYKVSVDTFNGTFTPGKNLDSGNRYYTDKTFIPALATTPDATTPYSTPIIANFNLAVTVPDTTGFSINGYASIPSATLPDTPAALGRIVAIEGRTLFLQVISLDSITPKVGHFYKSGTLINAKTLSESTVSTTIEYVEGKNYQLVLDADPGNVFLAGREIVTDGKKAAYIYKSSLEGTNRVIDISDVTTDPTSLTYFEETQQVQLDEVYRAVPTSPVATIDEVYALTNVYHLERGVYSEIRPQLRTGNELVYSVTPALPDGLALDTRSGLIFGTPALKTSSKEYIITAANLLGFESYPITLEVRDYFKISDRSITTSGILHKYGSHKQSRACKINADDILNPSSTIETLDVRCFLDVEEEELHNIALNITTSSGAGVCKFTELEPFSFLQFPAGNSAPVMPVTPGDPARKFITSGCATAADAPPGYLPSQHITQASSLACAYNYQATNGANCDGGSISVITVSGTEDPITGVCNISPVMPQETITCDGNANACMQGPIRDVLSEAEINLGYRSVTYNTASNSAPIEMRIKAPYTFLDKSNLRVANGMVNNSCTLSNTHANAFETHLANPAYVTPFSLKGKPFYSFNCLDAAKTTKARIRLAIRNWNQAFSINSLIDLDLPPALMNENGLDDFNKPKKEYNDWDNAYGRLGDSSSFGGVCNAPGPGSAVVPFPEYNL